MLIERIGRAKWVVPLALLSLFALVVFSLTLGRYPISTQQVMRILLGSWPLGATHSAADAPWVVVEIVRLPRVLEVTLCGMGLALAGAAMQGVFRNPLVGPEICGVSSAASFGGVLGILWGWNDWGIVGAAFACGVVCLALVFGLARLTGRTGTLTLILAGVIVGAFFAAALGLTQYLADPQGKLPQIIFWLLGSFAGATYEKVLIIAAVMLVAGTALLALRWRLNLLSLGEQDAAALGIDVEQLRWLIVCLVALVVAAQVSVSGGVGFVGLIVPHFARMLVGPEHSRLLPVSGCLGGLYLLAMDDLARSATRQEVPIGLLTAFVGAPIFAFLFWRQQARGWRGE